MLKTFFAAALALATVSTGSVAATPAVYRDPLDAPTLKTISSQFSKLMVLANEHDLKALHEMFWQSPSALLVAKSAIPSEGNWAGGMATYPANLCPLFGRAEFAGFREHLGQPIGEPVEAVSRRAVRQGSTEHFDCV